MPVILFGILILIGFVAGYFFKVYVLIALSALCVIVAIWCIATMREIEKLFTVIFIVGAVIANVAMWVTYYNVTTQTFLGDLMHIYVLR